MERFPLATGVNKPVKIRYLNQRSEVNDYNLLLLGLDEGWTDKDNRHRIYLAARDVDEATRTAKSFLYHRVIALFDGQTGEIVSDVPKYLNDVIDEVGGRKPKSWPVEKIYIRNVQASFREGEFAEHWRFGVPKSFAASLDVIFHALQSSGNEVVILQNCPVVAELRRGDVLHCPPHLTSELWGEWMRRGLISVTVECCTDSDGATEVMVREVDQEKRMLKRGKKVKISQRQLLGFLRTADSAYLSEQ